MTRIEHLKEAVIMAEENCLKTKTAAEREKEVLFATAKEHEDQLIHSSRLAELGEMAAAMAHELNQPLTGIKNYSRNAIYMLEEGKGSEEDIRDNLQQISRQVDRSTKIINQLRELARKTEYDFTLININEVVKESLEFLDCHLKLSGVTVKSELANHLPPVWGDKVRLEQVFLNILTNARQAMEGCEKRTLIISTFKEDKEPFPVNVVIRDSGCGFKPQDADKLFTPFYTTKNPGQGTGLGLSISLSIVKSHQGSIEATGEIGKGACFTIKIPSTQQRDS
jgi:C4-dicarboxylate-specific signal transduction histidine kinase